MPGTAHTWVDGDVATAAFLNALPRGVMGYAVGPTSDQTGITTTMTDMTSLSVTFTAISSRIYRTTVTAAVQQITATAVARCQIADGAGTQKLLRDLTLVVNDEGLFVVTLIETGLSGSVTRKGMANCSAGSLSIIGTVNRMSNIIVEDLGV